jgi:anti-anti-sigma factor
MPLNLETRFCWNIYIIQCRGSIVEGRELDLLQLALDQAVSEFRHLILEVRGVDHLDGSGMGLLVRYALRLRKRGGDLRLAGLSPAVLARWKQEMLSRILEVYPAEEDAIASFVRGACPREAAPIAGPRVLVLDESADMCTFVTAVLTQLGFAVESATCFWDARLLLDVEAADYILLGPDVPRLPIRDVISALRVLAPQACVLQLDREFKFRDSLESTETLLEMFGTPALGATGRDEPAFVGMSQEYDQTSSV